MKKTTIQKYIEDAVNAATKGASINNVKIEMKLDVGEVVTELASALKMQAEANKATAEAMEELAIKLIPQEVTAIRIENQSDIKIGDTDVTM